MKKFLLVLILILLSVAIGWNWNRNQSENIDKDDSVRKTVLLRFALIADSHNENDLLKKTFSQAQGAGVNFVIGLGDYTNVGTLKELNEAKKVFDDSSLEYYVTAGDRDLWDSRNRGENARANFEQIFGNSTGIYTKEGIQFVILDNSDIYKGIVAGDWSLVTGSFKEPAKLRFFFSHKTPFHPQSSHIMGEDSSDVARQAQSYLDFLESNKVDGFFSGDLHFFAQFNSPNESVKITTVGAVNSTRNFQGPRFALVTVFDDYTWKVEDFEIR
jgi:hypothetical protein